MRRLSRNPSLKNELGELMADAYGDAILSASRETGLEAQTFPADCPWDYEQLTDSQFYPQ